MLVVAAADVDQGDPHLRLVGRDDRVGRGELLQDHPLDLDPRRG